MTCETPEHHVRARSFAAQALVAALALATIARGDQGPLRIDQAPPDAVAKAWQPVFRGIEHVALRAEQPRLMRGQALRIDTNEPTVHFFVSPSNGDRPLEADSITTSHFLGKFHLQAAINAAPFDPVVNDEGVPQDVVGLAISKGERVSPPETGKNLGRS